MTFCIKQSDTESKRTKLPHNKLYKCKRFCFRKQINATSVFLRSHSNKNFRDHRTEFFMVRQLYREDTILQMATTAKVTESTKS